MLPRNFAVKLKLMHKQIISSLLFATIFLLSSISMSAQQNDYQGYWLNDLNKDQVDEHTSGVLHIGPEASVWNVFNNKMLLDFVNKMEGNTLLLVYKSADLDNEFRNSNIKFPKSGKVVARCTLQEDGELHMEYVDRKFVQSVFDYAHMSNTEKKKIFPEVMYLYTGDDE